MNGFDLCAAFIRLRVHSRNQNTMNLVMPLSRPPRNLPLSTRLVVLFGSGTQSFGWLFFGFGMIFVFAFAGNADLTSFIEFRGKLETVTGIVSSEEKTRASEGGDDHTEGTPIYAYRYTFNLDEKNYEAVSYRTGSGARAGDTVTVEFPEGKPELSRIRGMRRAVFGPAVVLVCIFPIVGLMFITSGLWRGWRNTSLLVNGEMALGRLVKKQATNVQINGRTVFKLAFEFTDRAGQSRQAVAKTHIPERLEDDHFERLIYDAVNSDKTLLMDSLPGEQGLTASGEIKSCESGRVLAAVLPPAVTVIAIVAYCCWKCLR